MGSEVRIHGEIGVDERRRKALKYLARFKKNGQGISAVTL